MFTVNVYTKYQNALIKSKLDSLIQNLCKKSPYKFTFHATQNHFIVFL